jgi:hypothetical protein
MGGRLALISVVLLCLGGCVGGDDANDARRVAERWLAAGARGDGRVYCDLLSEKRRIEAEAEAGSNQMTCAQQNSTHPPGSSRRELRELALARRQAAVALTIDWVRVDDDRATVGYSWRAPANPSPILSFKSPDAAGRVHDSLPLVRDRGEWRIGRD